MAEKTLLIVDDNVDLAKTLARSFERRGVKVAVAKSTEEALEIAPNVQPYAAVVDLKMAGASGLDCVKGLHTMNPEMRIVVLTGYASIATAVEAIKRGACQYLAKPANAAEILAALDVKNEEAAVEVGTKPSSLKTLEWERINQVLADTDYNVSETARRLGLHRRTLARKLAKRPLN